ncbi:hypothetical protein lerEdw1_010067 [Lerista edwardsae]|nr:hypothetical protein lerEdw1_010067 [Lerista edwardsae]
MEPEPEPAPGLGWGWAALVLLFAASLLTVSAWLLQFARGLWRGRGRPAEAPRGKAAGLWASLLRLASARGGARSEAAGARGLLASLFAFRAFRENWQRAWLRALNEQARRHGSSVQIAFEESPQLLPAVSISHVSCADQSDRSMQVLRCHLSADPVQFPVSVTQQSPAAVSMETYHVTLAVTRAQLEVHLEEVPGEGLLLSWAFRDRPDLKLSVVPRLQLREENDGKVDLSTIEDLIEDSVVSTQPAMMVNLRACIAGSSLASCKKLPQGSPSSPAVPRLLLQHLRGLHLGCEETRGCGPLRCVVELDSPWQQKQTRPVPSSSASPAAEVEWADRLALELGPRSKELKLSVLGSGEGGEDVLLGFATVPLGSPSMEPRGQQQLLLLNPGTARMLPSAAAIAVELLYQEGPELQPGSGLRPSITPTKKVEMDRTIMPDGTIVTTVTTIQSRPKMDCKLDSPSRSPSKVEVTEKVTTVLPENGCPGSASPSSSRAHGDRSTPAPPGSSRISNGLDPVAETAIRQLTDLTNKPAKKTPTKRSTLIISGVSKVPLAQDEAALSLGYAASLEDASLAGMSEYAQSLTEPLQPLDASHAAQRASQELDETTRSDISERPSVEDVESETGSTGALETRSLKDHKVNFLRSGTKLIFRRKNKQKEAGLSQSHDDLPKAGAGSAPRKKSGSFSRRLLKRFSFKSRPKAQANGGSSLAVDKP